MPGVKETYLNEGQHEEVNRQIAQTFSQLFLSSSSFIFFRQRKTPHDQIDGSSTLDLYSADVIALIGGHDSLNLFSLVL